MPRCTTCFTPSYLSHHIKALRIGLFQVTPRQFWWWQFYRNRTLVEIPNALHLPMASPSLWFIFSTPLKPLGFQHVSDRKNDAGLESSLNVTKLSETIESQPNFLNTPFLDTRSIWLISRALKKMTGNCLAVFLFILGKRWSFDKPHFTNTTFQ